MMNIKVLRKLYKKYIDKLVPEYALLSLITCFCVSGIVYWGSQLIMQNKFHYDLSSSLDRHIFLVKEWIIIYIVCYAFWVINYILIAREGKEKWYRFVNADIMSKLICGVFYILLPTTIIRPQVLGGDIFSCLVRFIYNSDPPTNLFPSIHCLVSWFCFIGIRNSKKIPTWYKLFSFIFAVLVCISTQFTKQHILIDVAGGIMIAELSYYVTNHTQIYRSKEKFFDCLGRKLFGVTYYDK